MAALDQLPAPLDLRCIAGDPLVWRVTASGATFSSPDLDVLVSQGGVAVAGITPTVSYVAGAFVCSLSDADTATIKARSGAGGPVVAFWSLAAVVNGSGRFQLGAGQIKVLPVGSAGTGSSTASGTVTIASGVTIALSVSLGAGQAPNIDGGAPDAVFGGTVGIDGGSL